jgi:acetyl esterase/lipase
VHRIILHVVLFALLNVPVSAQFSWQNMARDYRVQPNITYNIASGVELKMDVYVPANSAAPRPAILFCHGSGWAPDARPINTRERSVLHALPRSGARSYGDQC